MESGSFKLPPPHALDEVAIAQVEGTFHDLPGFDAASAKMLAETVAARVHKDRLFDAMLALLKELEWAGPPEIELDPSRPDVGTYRARCPSCLNQSNGGHATDCELAAILKAAEAVGEG